MANSTYDKEADKERSPISDNSVSGNQTSPGKTNNTPSNPYNKSLQNQEASGGGSNPHKVSNDQAGSTAPQGASSNTGDSKRAANPEELKNAESSPSQNFSFNSDDDRGGGGGKSRGKNQKKKLGPGSKLKKKAILMAVGAVGGIISLLILGFLAIIPLKIEHIVSILEKHFFASSENAIESEDDSLLKGYFKDHLLPAFKSCRIDSTTVSVDVSRRCNINFANPKNNPVINLYKGWRDANLETKLANNYGIEFRYAKGTNGRSQWYLKAPGTNVKGDPIGDGSGLDNEFKTRASMRAAVDAAMTDVTGWQKVMFRYKVGRLLEEKYGIKRCIVFCGVQDAFNDKKDQSQYAAKAFIVERVIAPRSAAMGSLLNCILIDPSACSQKSSSTTCTEQTCDELAGKSETVAETDVASAVGAATAGFGEETASKLMGEVGAIRDAGGFNNYVINKIFNKFFNKEESQNVTDEVPVIGELQILNQAASFVNTVSSASQKIKAYSYLVNSGAAVSMFTMFQTYASEIHTGKVTATEVGSFTQALGPGDQCVPKIDVKDKCPSVSKQVGGTAEAENTPLYSRLIAGNNTTQIPKNYKCSGGSLVKKSDLVCPEEKLGQTNASLSKLSNTFNALGLTGLAKAYDSTPIPAILGLVNSATGFLTSSLSSLLSSLLPSFITNGIQNLAKTMFTFIATQLIPNPFGSPESGGRTFDMMAAGGDVAGNDYAHTGLGGKRLSPVLAANIQNQQENEAKQQFQSQPLFARLFSTDSDYSLVSKLALDVPFGVSSTFQTNFASLMNPLSVLSSTFGSLFNSNVSAASSADPDPFGVTQYGYASSDIPNDPQQYWDAHCEDNPATGYQNPNDPLYKQEGPNGWNGDTTTDSANGQDVNTTTNPCMLIKGTVGNTGATSDSSLLTQDDQADINGTSSSATSTPPPSTGTLPTGSAKDLANQILPYLQNGKIKCLTTGCPDIVNTAKGTSIRAGSCQVDSLQPGILGLILGLAQMGHTFILSALCSDHQTVDGPTEHNGGRAADFNTIDGVFMGPDNVPWDNTKITAGEKLDQDATTLIPDKTKLQFGQVGAGNGDPQCHPTFSFQSGYTTYPDLCHHQHIAVEP